MSSRSHDSRKGSSRSTRDASRTDRSYEKDKFGKNRSRSRSRSPRRKHSSSRSRKYDDLEKRTDYEDKRYDEKNSNDWEASEEEVPAPPPPPRISKISIGFKKPDAPMKINLAGPTKTASVAPKPTVASVFNTDDDDDEPEEMPAEARMRMRNIGRETPTSAGPNSFGKTKQGFCDAKKVFEKNLKAALETVEKPKSTMKFPQTIYKINGP